MNAVSTRQPLAALRRHLVVWYATTLGLILLLLGGGLYGLIHQQLREQLDHSLASAAQEIMRAAKIREVEAKDARGAVLDAVEELRIPDRSLFLFDTAGVPAIPGNPTQAIRRAALAAVKLGVARAVEAGGNEHEISIHAERFRLTSGQTMVAVASADQIELADRYAALIAAFSGVAIFAIVLSTIGGYFLVQQATAPAEQQIAHTRRFVADAAHELRTPISVLRTKSEVILQEPRSQEVYVGALTDIEREARRLGRITDNLLMLARADAGVRPATLKRIFLDDVVANAMQPMQTLAEAAGVQLSVNAFEEAPVLGDESLIQEMVIILLDNAIKFTPSGGSVTVSVTSAPTSTLTIEDTGVGITAGQAAHVFERFYRGDPSRPRDKGVGLGLSIAQWIAGEHGAEIKLAAARAKGTIASVTFQKLFE